MFQSWINPDDALMFVQNSLFAVRRHSGISTKRELKILQIPTLYDYLDFTQKPRARFEDHVASNR